jgi:hypothetical protein
MPNYSGIWTEQAVMQAVGAGNWPGNPGAPTIGTATAGVFSASVAFTAPTTNGGSAITSYTATSSPGGFTGTAASSPITVSGLTAGTTYTFTVTATNATGTSPASAASNSITALSPNYIEDVYSTYLYTGNGTTQTITNGINLSGNGGLVWMKNRSANGSYTESHGLFDTTRGAYYGLNSNGTAASTNYADMGVSAFGTTGFDTKNRANPGAGWNNINITYASWTFREQAKFFDIVTYTGTGSAQNIAHSLGSTPGFIIVKQTSGVGGWYCYHRYLGATQYIVLNSASSLGAAIGVWNNTAPTSSVFTVGSFSEVNGSGQSYVAYVYAHDAGGFGVNGTDNVISCGSYTGSSSNIAINLGYEAQWVLVKNIGRDSTDWQMLDIMRGMPLAGSAKTLAPNLSNAESSPTAPVIVPTATGMTITGGLGFTINYDGDTYIYVAIRRGLMAVPTDATKVYTSVLNNDFTNGVVIPGQPTVDASWSKGTSANQMRIFDRLRGSSTSANYTLYPNSTSTESNEAYWALDQQNGVRITATLGTIPYVNYFFSRAPSYFDEVCYTGNGTTQNITHNLTVVPELLIVKRRSGGSGGWPALVTNINKYGFLDGTFAFFNAAPEINLFGNNTNYVPPTSSAITVGLNTDVNAVSSTYVAYLFATCAGVSKVGSYTGTGATQTINCGFAAGVRFILIKRTDSTGDWYLFNSASGITSGNDPYFLLNSIAAEVTGTNYVDTTAVGFQVTAAAPAGLNASGGTFIFLAIA